jgi:hypothetical protein
MDTGAPVSTGEREGRGPQRAQRQQPPQRSAKRGRGLEKLCRKVLTESSVARRWPLSCAGWAWPANANATPTRPPSSKLQARGSAWAWGADGDKATTDNRPDTSRLTLTHDSPRPLATACSRAPPTPTLSLKQLFTRWRRSQVRINRKMQQRRRHSRAHLHIAMATEGEQHGRARPRRKNRASATATQGSPWKLERRMSRIDLSSPSPQRSVQSKALRAGGAETRRLTRRERGRAGALWIGRALHVRMCMEACMAGTARQQPARRNPPRALAPPHSSSTPIFSLDTLRRRLTPHGTHARPQAHLYVHCHARAAVGGCGTDAPVPECVGAVHARPWSGSEPHLSPLGCHHAEDRWAPDLGLPDICARERSGVTRLNRTCCGMLCW